METEKPWKSFEAVPGYTRICIRPQTLLGHGEGLGGKASPKVGRPQLRAA